MTAKLEKYSMTMRVMHWLMAIVIIALLAVGIWMAGLPSDAPNKFDFYPLHKSFGVVALILVLLRLSIRMRTHVPAKPKGVSNSDDMLSKIAVVILYLGMFAMPMSGYAMSMFGGHGVMLFGYPLPNILPLDKELGGYAHTLHGWIGYTMVAVITLHILGTFKHILMDKINILSRMW